LIQGIQFGVKGSTLTPYVFLIPVVSRVKGSNNDSPGFITPALSQIHFLLLRFRRTCQACQEEENEGYSFHFGLDKWVFSAKISLPSMLS
jgi:hypothetical protein